MPELFKFGHQFISEYFLIFSQYYYQYLVKNQYFMLQQEKCDIPLVYWVSTYPFYEIDKSKERMSTSCYLPEYTPLLLPSPILYSTRD